MEWVAVQSSNVAAVGYDAERRVLGVRFSNGSEYEYRDVPESVYTNFLTSESPGQYFSRVVRNAGFSYARIN